jgi:hypothetical protein
VTAGTLTGTGFIAADGGAGELYEGGGGGGGRIAIYARTNNFSGLVSAFGGPGFSFGEDGSIYSSTNLPALQVIAQTPTGIVSNGVSTVYFTFNTALKPASISSTSVAVNTPNGPLPSGFLSAGMSGTSQALVNFPQQTTPGDYTVTVGSQVQTLQGQPMSQPYLGTFTISLPVIQGTVTDTNGQPVAGVLLGPEGGFASAATDNNGNYALGVVPGWSGTVVPANGTFMFVPGSKTYTNVSLSISNQNYLMVDTIAPTMAAQLQNTNLALSWYGIPGVSYQALYSTNLVDWLPYGGVLSGSNSMMQVVLPMNTDPMKFFRMQTSN